MGPRPISWGSAAAAAASPPPLIWTTAVVLEEGVREQVTDGFVHTVSTPPSITTGPRGTQQVRCRCPNLKGMSWAQTHRADVVLKIVLLSHAFNFSMLLVDVTLHLRRIFPCRQGYNICNSTTLGDKSWCQTAFVNSIDDFCVSGTPHAPRLRRTRRHLPQLPSLLRRVLYLTTSYFSPTAPALGRTHC